MTSERAASRGPAWRGRSVARAAPAARVKWWARVKPSARVEPAADARSRVDAIEACEWLVRGLAVVRGFAAAVVRGFAVAVVLAHAVAPTACVTAPSRVDLRALVAKLGPTDARHELEVRIVDDPKDIAARLALAKLCEQQGRPSQAIAQLEAVVQLGGPLGTRWHAEDRARLARLLAARGRARLDRGAPTAAADLARARELGARIADDELARARLVRAIGRVRHVSDKERAAGLAALRDHPTVPRDRGALGAWLWQRGAKRAAWEQLAAWHAATPPARRPEHLQRAYLAAHAWWTPIDGARPAPTDLVGPERCRYHAADCNPWELVQNGLSSEAIDALAAAPPRRTSDPDEAFGWLAITLGQALRGEAPWGASFAARVDVSAIPVDAFPAGGRAAFAILAGRAAPDDAAGAGAADRSIPARYLAAAAVALRGGTADDVRAELGALADTVDGRALVAVVEPGPAKSPPAGAFKGLHAVAVDFYLHSRLGVSIGSSRAAQPIVDAYAIDPVRADRVAADVVAGFADGALGHAVVGAVFDALEDPARARAAWQAAVDDSPEPTFVRGLALAIARANDPDAALIAATTAAAAWGDPARVWIDVAEALHGVGAHVHALEAARSAIDLASADTIGRALDVAIAASEALGRTTQVTALRGRRAAVAPPVLAAPRADDPTDPAGALASGSVDRLWTAARWSPRDVALRVALLAALPANDPRRTPLIAALVVLARDHDVDRARGAIRALRGER